MATRAPTRDVERPWAVLPFVVPFLVTLTATMGAVDLAYQVRLGDGILGSGALPRVDTFTFTVPGASWLDQQWGAQVLLAIAHRATGWAGLIVLRASLISATCGLVYLACRARGAGRRTSALLALGGLAVGQRGLALRPQLLALVVVAASLWVLAGRRDHPRRVWWLPVLAVALANLHGAFVLVPVLAGLAVLEDLVDRHPGARRTLLVGLAATAATLVNPYGVAIWRYAADIATDPVIRDTITEWRPVSLSTLAGAGFVASVVLVVALVVRRGWPPDVAALAWFLVFGAIAVTASRGIVLWGIVAPTVAARMLPPRRDPAPVPVSGRTLAWSAAVVAICALTVPVWRGTSPDRLLSKAPVGLSDALARTVPAGSHVFAFQAWASWLEYAVPEDRIFVDSRIELFPAGVWREYADVRLARGAWSSILGRYGVDAIVVDADNGGLLPRLRGQSSWSLAYEDEEGALFVRAGGAG